jgi:hypothetical protein
VASPVENEIAMTLEPKERQHRDWHEGRIYTDHGHKLRI